MKKKLLAQGLLLLFVMSTVCAFLVTQQASADASSDIQLLPTYYKGGAELKRFNMTIGDGQPISQFIVSFPPIKAGDTDYKPTAYGKPNGWEATYEKALRQVMFASTDPPYNLPVKPGLWFTYFNITFVDGPIQEGPYEWTLTTTDEALVARTYYRVQTIDRTPPTITITTPKNDEVVKAIYDDWPEPYYLWTNGTVSDTVSGVKEIWVKVYRKGFDTGWVRPTVRDDRWYYKWYNAQVPAGYMYNVTARAVDRALNEASARNQFTYVPEGPHIILTPNEGFVGPETVPVPETEWYNGTILYVGSKRLGTPVRIDGSGFNPNAMVKVYAGDLLVREIKADSDGRFTIPASSFAFPTFPGGLVRCRAEDDGSPNRYLLPPLPTFKVLPEIAFDPEVIIGPAVIKAIATGLPANLGSFDGFTCDGTDALLTINRHVVLDWYTDSNGILKTRAGLSPGFLMPVLQSGTYEIALWRDVEASSLVLVVDNKLTVTNNFDELMEAIDEIFNIEDKLDYLKPIIETIDDNVATIKTDVGTIKADVKSLIESVNIIKADVVEIKTKVGTIQGKVDSISWGDVLDIKTTVGIIKAKVDAIVWGDITTIKTDLGTIKAKVDAIVWGDITTIKTNIGDIKVKIEDLDPETIAEILANTEDLKTTTLSIPITAVLSAIAAIAAIAAAVVVTRRLKVAT